MGNTSQLKSVVSLADSKHSRAGNGVGLPASLLFCDLVIRNVNLVLPKYQIQNVPNTKDNSELKPSASPPGDCLVPNSPFL